MGTFANKRSAQRIKVFKTDEVKAYTDAVNTASSVYDTLRKRIEDTDKAVFLVNNTLSDFQRAHRRQGRSHWTRSRRTGSAQQFSTAVQGGRAGVDKFRRRRSRQQGSRART